MNKFMNEAIIEAKKGLSDGGIPVGAVLVYNDEIIARGHNRRVQRSNPILHAEMAAIENAGCQPISVYRECTLYTTGSPCMMCSGAIMVFGIGSVVVGENRSFQGEEELLRQRGIKVTVLQDKDCIQMMDEFINNNPHLWLENIGKK